METKKNEKCDLERKRPLFFGIGMTIALSMTLVAFEWKSPIDPINVFAPEEVMLDELIDIPLTKITPPPPPPPKAIEVVEVKDDEDVTEEIPPIDIETIEEQSIEDIPYEEPPIEVVEEAPKNFAEVMPSYEGGMQNFYQFISNNIKYPTKAKRMGIEGRVFVQFIVEKDGSLSNIKTVKGIGAGCDQEAVRVMKLVQGFSPAKQGDIRVRLQMIVPINFTLQ